LKLLSLESINTVKNLQLVLSKFIEPPNEQYVKDSVTILMRLGLIENNVITKLGKIISDLQVDPMQGLSIYYSYQLGCVKEVIAIISMIDALKGNISELFLVPKLLNNLNDNQQKRQHFDHLTKKFESAKKSLADSTGDHLTLLKIFFQYIKLRKEKNDQKLNDWLYKYFLKKSVLEKANKYYLKLKGASISKLKNDMSINWKLHKQKTRILTSIFCGFFLNTIFLKDKNNKNNKNISISKDSFLSQSLSIDNEIIYNEFTTINGNTSASIVSKLSKSIRTFYSEIPQ
jgi:HrpA-like RNA helicase